MQAKNSTEWYTLPEIAWLIGGVNNSTMMIAAVLGLDGYHFRCLVTDGQRSEYSNTVSLRCAIKHPRQLANRLRFPVDF